MPDSTDTGLTGAQLESLSDVMMAGLYELARHPCDTAEKQRICRAFDARVKARGIIDGVGWRYTWSDIEGAVLRYAADSPGKSARFGARRPWAQQTRDAMAARAPGGRRIFGRSGEDEDA
jgi:hypothetical protein